MRRRDLGPVVQDWPPHLAVFHPERWSGGDDSRLRLHRWFAWVGARQDWLMAQGVEQNEAGALAFDTTERPEEPEHVARLHDLHREGLLRRNRP